MSVCVTNFRRALLTSAAFALLANCQLANAQTLPGAAPADSAPAGANQVAAAQTAVGPETLPTEPAASRMPALGSGPNPEKSALAGFQMDTTVILSESYVSNSTGIGQHSAPDYLTTLGLTTDLHDHTARLSLDASY